MPEGADSASRTCTQVNGNVYNPLQKGIDSVEGTPSIKGICECPQPLLEAGTTPISPNKKLSMTKMTLPLVHSCSTNDT